jgi:hypothetical protein
MGIRAGSSFLHVTLKSLRPDKIWTGIQHPTNGGIFGEGGDTAGTLPLSMSIVLLEEKSQNLMRSEYPK